MMNIMNAPMVQQNSGMDLDASPIGNKNNDDDLDFEKELLDATSQSFLNQSNILGNNFDDNSLAASNQQTGEPPKKKLEPPKPPPLSFSEQIALASSKLKSKSEAMATITPIRKDLVNPNDKKKMSTMDALKEQIMLRKASMNPT